ncbi:hypothetical protein CAI21_00375 [Alkalilimnicola ehrlichii]|uniref:Cytochrome c domain-containing protein n=1 Tax=Alkalilimnicola ehrlichii TaxID=351052 RepID=A0A3E0X3Y8_9GAMM|nr:cytochrome c [Alkalilimnicola ehrlichii]RFA31153.1 hypothetical protein CAI21_00375 [Alkalilimnicola ehrlichii]RFA39562.1 hypothetical protein CAL65_02030 [Alkalilimnicola ehrlichii]
MTARVNHEKHLLIVIALPLLFSVGLAQAASIERGQARSTSCAACHGAKGISALPTMYPDLAGQSVEELKQALQDFRSGERSDAVMRAQARGLSDQDIADLAAYYASLEPRK